VAVKKLNTCLGSARTMTFVFHILIVRQMSLDDSKAAEDSLMTSSEQACNPAIINE